MFTAALLIVFFSCSTAKEIYREKKIIDIKSFDAKYSRYEEDEKLFSLVQIILDEEKKGIIDTEYLEEKKSDLIIKIQEDFDKSITDKKYLKALNTLESIKTAEMEEYFVISKDRNTLLIDYIQDEAENENFINAFYTLLKYADLNKNKDSEVLKVFAEKAYLAQNRFVLNKLLLNLPALDDKTKDRYRELIDKKEDPSDMLDGTVTIWVNKGIKVESGIGTADRSIGSGFFIDKRGYIITNYHVIESEVNPEYEGYSRLYIRLSDFAGTKVPAKVIGWDPVFDIALLKTELTPEYIFTINNGIEYKPGESIIAIGSPGGLDKTITSGIISNVGRRFLPIGDSLQVDVPINPGNSGGPLINSDGELIGIVFAGIEQFEGVNFAIPVHWIIDFLPDLYKGGEVTHSWFGISVYEKNKKLEILYTVPGEAASLAGLQKGDIIKSLNGMESKNIIQVQKQMLSYCPDRLVKVIYERNGKDNEAVIALGTRPDKAFDLAIKRDSMKNVILPLFGMDLESTGNYLFKEGYSVKKVYDGSVADETGISVNDPLTIKAWKYDFKKRYALLRIFVKKRKAGFMESGIQLITSLDSNNLL